MPAYAFVTLDITDPEKLAAYRERAGDALAKHGGKVLQASPEPTVLEGDIAAPQIAVVLEFDTREGAVDWRADPDLVETHALRTSAGRTSITLL
ncbi:DUF1330 domain-containing protein [Roseobacter sinensis]|uniref:DUF1330 domain-containing protein n=1 Tax=Roseobacter sinensis TaxID=2931391 RepID=A0ABT3BDP4_9RHOB|nr:DUF1330 domain-containing protein [Roseobacter sp. WL0113]MCV3271706.1 DUF1330 domain-containing protein [Roseobacter sp. WL0113]